MMTSGLLLAIIFLPLVGALILGCLPKANKGFIKALALGFSGATFVASLIMLYNFKADTFHFQMEENHQWLPQLG
ncbi:hypothetical protein, partial [Pseudomonas aeruginosa]|uniref:hypothetical protein n=1 Tax=Pseudomonas aeruginosa TaxID=287 RepID=UPI002B406E48